jgi:hypothetical protein
MKFSADSLAALHGIKVIVSDVVPDNQIVFREDNHPARSFASYKLTIWYLDTGKMAGNADITKADEMHMSPRRYDELKRMTGKISG